MSASRKQVISVQVVGTDHLSKNVQYLRQNFPGYVSKANALTAEEIKERAEQNILDIDAYDTGALHGSIRIGSRRGGLSYAVGSVAKHAPFIEYGTAPHFPPLEPIRQWCIRKGIPPGMAYPIARKIAERGTPPRPFLGPAYEWGKRRYYDRVRSLVWLAMKGDLR